MSVSHTIVIEGGIASEPLPVVFEMRGPTVEVPPGERLRLGPENADLTIGVGRNGVSIYRDLELKVDVYGADGGLIDTAGFA